MTDDTAKKKDKSWFWPKIDDAVSAREVAKAGALGGGILLALLLVGMGFVYFSGDYVLFNATDLGSE
jgi:hypothetical protein